MRQGHGIALGLFGCTTTGTQIMSTVIVAYDGAKWAEAMSLSSRRRERFRVERHFFTVHKIALRRATGHPSPPFQSTHRHDRTIRRLPGRQALTKLLAERVDVGPAGLQSSARRRRFVVETVLDADAHQSIIIIIGIIHRQQQRAICRAVLRGPRAGARVVPLHLQGRGPARQESAIVPAVGPLIDG
jgi:hypothetical protein